MHSYLEARIKEVDIYRITSQELKLILSELFRHAYWNNVYIEESYIVRDDSHKWYFFDFDWGHMSFEIEILLLKMYRVWLIDIQLFDCDLDLDTEVWKKFYKFLDKHAIISDTYTSSETWSTEYDIDKLTWEHYKDFIQHIYDNIIIEDVEDRELDIDDYLSPCSDRLTLRANISNSRMFFDKISSIIANQNKDNIQHRVNIIKELNNVDNELYIGLSDFVESKWHYYRYLKYLESKWKLDITEVAWKTNNAGCICFGINKRVDEFKDIFLEGLPYENNNGVQYISWDIFIWKEKINFQKGSKIHMLFKLIFDYFLEHNTNTVTHYELWEFYKNNLDNYSFKQEPTFNYDWYRRNIEKKNEELSFKDFLGIDYKAITCKYLEPETLY